jgi:predicted RNA-binding protein with PUA-like domain
LGNGRQYYTIIQNTDQQNTKNCVHLREALFWDEKQATISAPSFSPTSVFMQYWLIKSEPDVYSWDTFVAEGNACWSGVRNYQARNNLRAMQLGDMALYYHSNIGKEVVGIAEVTRESYQDPTTDNPNWLCVDVRPKQAFTSPVTLETIKAEERLAQMGLIRQSRLSVVRLTEDEFNLICAMGMA